MKFDNPASILKRGNVEPEAGLIPGGDDWLSRVNQTINNFRELLKIAAQFKGSFNQGDESMEPKETSNNLGSLGNPPGLSDYLGLAIKAGYGDVTIEKIIENANPLTLKQIMELLKRVGFK